MENNLFTSQDFNEKYLESYRQEQSDPTNKNHQFDSDTTTATVNTPNPPRAVTAVTEVKAFGYPVIDFANTLLPGGAPVGSRHGTALKLAQDLLIICDGNQEAVRQLLLQLSWVKDVVAERGEKEIDDIMDAAKKLMHKRESEYLNALQPSREMRRAIEQLTNRKYNQLVRETHQKMVGNVSGEEQDEVIELLERIGREIEKLFPHYPLIKQLCYRQKRKHYIAALLVGGAFFMTLKEAENFPRKNVLTNALGVWESVRCDINVHQEQIDGLLLCSDGLHGYVSEEHIMGIVMNHDMDPTLRGRKLLKAALDAGGYDNITIVLIDLEGEGSL